MTTYTTNPSLEAVTAVGNILDAMAIEIKQIDDKDNVLLLTELNRIFDDLFNIQEALFTQWTNAVSASLFEMRKAK
jgi:hypothetical protein